MSDPPKASSSGRAELARLFRHEHGRVVALLARRVGVAHLAAVEDAVQAAMLAALHAWAASGVPLRPSAWLYQVAWRELAGELRKERRRAVLRDALRDEEEPRTWPDEAAFEREVRDEQLKMLFLCCDERLPEVSRLVLALKVLSGFHPREIAARLDLTEANVRKRLTRAQARLRQDPPVDQPLDAMRERLGSVRAVLYLLFNEGYLSNAEPPIREELCADAIRLGTLLAEHPMDGSPPTCALLALMHLHASRLGARRDSLGGLLLLEEQDRGRWDRAHLAEGAAWLARASAGDSPTRFHIEASIAAEHARAPSFAETRWDRIAERYEWLMRVDPSPLHHLNRAIALAEVSGPRHALETLGGEVPEGLEGSCVGEAALADLLRRAGHSDRAAEHARRAIAAAPSEPVRALLRRRLASPE